MFTRMRVVPGRASAGMAIVALGVYPLIAWGLRLIPPFLELPGGSAFILRPWLLPIVQTAFSCLATGLSFQRIAREPEQTEPRRLLETLRFTLVAIASLDGMVLVIVGLAHLLMSRDDF